MRTLRHNKNRLAIFLLLAMVFAILGVPAFAANCGEMPFGSDHAIAASVGGTGLQSAGADASCPMMSSRSSCCCHPQQEAAVRNPHGMVSAPDPGCCCSLEAPDAPPATAPQVALRIPVPVLAILPRAALTVTLPADTPWVFAAPATGPPRSAVLASVPSRAPPAC